MSGAEQSTTIDLESIDHPWTDFFPYQQPYQDQVDGIETFLDALAGHNHMLMEGACGTGKTLVGLAAGLTAARANDAWRSHRNKDVPSYERVFIATPVKQQLKQFVQEMRDINENRRQNIPTVVLRGQTDMVPYLDEEVGPVDIDRDAVQDFRRRARELVDPESRISIPWGEVNANDLGYTPPEEGQPVERFDPNRIKAVLELLERDSAEDPMTVAGTTLPYPATLPTLRRLDPELPEHKDGKFDPLYIGYLAHEHPNIRHRDSIRFQDLDQSIVDTRSLRSVALDRGVCPHSQMTRLLADADVIIGNYYHVLDPTTRQLTKKKVDVLDEETVLILDEAHNVENVARDVFSRECSRQTLDETLSAIGAVEAIAQGRQDDFATINTGRNPFTVFESLSQLEEFQNDVVDIVEPICSQTSTELFELLQQEKDNKTRSNWGGLEVDQGEERKSEAEKASHRAFNGISAITQMLIEEVIGSNVDVRDAFRPVAGVHRRLITHLQEYTEIELSNDFPNYEYPDSETVDEQELDRYEISIDQPTEARVDPITDEITSEFGKDLPSGYQDVWSLTEDVIAIVEIVDRLLPTDDNYTTTGGHFAVEWGSADRMRYFREIIIEPAIKDQLAAEAPDWEINWTARYRIHNTIPTDRLRERFSEIGGALLMSATLQPFDAFRETTGITTSLYPDEYDQQLLQKIATDRTTDQVQTRSVLTREYPLRFPESNRGTYVLNHTKFTYSNRGAPTTVEAQMSTCRRKYLQTVETALNELPNSLICMPSYREAEWLATLLEDRTEVTVYLDESSHALETDQLLDEFMQDDNATLVTSSLGTVIEGVDYEGDALHGAIVVGIPIKPQTDRRKATVEAYDEQLDLDGWTAVNTIPAVRKARQAIGRVIRGAEERGVRLFIDERYSYPSRQRRDGVRDYLGDQEQHELQRVSPSLLQEAIQRVLNNE